MSSTVNILFAEGHKIFSKLIMRVTWSRFSHVGIVDETGEYVYEAEAFMGVVKTPMKSFIERYNGKVVRETFRCESPEKAYAFINAQLGKSYDYMGILGFIFKTSWQSKDSWFCSELISKAMEEGGTPLFRKEYDSRITPEDLWKVNPELTKK